MTLFFNYTNLNFSRFFQFFQLLESSIAMYKCLICGYLYNSVDGDPLHNIEPDTPFEDIPDTWVCPVCGVTKEHFEKVK